MKISAKQFDISSDCRPKVLFLGNGLCRAYGGKDWNDVLDKIKDENKFPGKANQYDIPMSLKAAMLTGGNLAGEMRKMKSENFDSFIQSNPEQRVAIRQFADLGFDYIITTNYSYEIESALLDKEKLTERNIERMLAFSGVDNAQRKYFINTFNKINDYQVWHIHGEARKPDSMIIGQFYYGNLLFNYKNYFDKRGYHYKSVSAHKFVLEVNSWLDAFVFGDVYIVGFGFDFSETDLWWLLEKKKLTECHGKTYFFNPIERNSGNCPFDDKIECKKFPEIIRADDCKRYLFESYDVIHENLNFEIKNKEIDYKTFYQNVSKYLKKKLPKGELS